MANYALERIKNLLKKDFGDIGEQIYQTSISMLDIREDPTAEDIKVLTSDLEGKLAKLFSDARSKEFIDKLNRDLAEEEKKLRTELRAIVDNFFVNKGIPAESDIEDQTKYLISKGFRADEGTINDILKQLSRDKLVSALNDSIINSEIRTFLNRYQSYTQSDLEDFINYMKRVAKLQVNDVVVREMIEMERLFRKFNNMGQEDPWQVKICRQYIALFNSSKKSQYKYLALDDVQLRLMSKIAS